MAAPFGAAFFCDFNYYPISSRKGFLALDCGVMGMHIFMSWSGDRSRAVAELMSEWLKCVIQACRPWVSSRDIDRGAIWVSEISDRLKDVSLGIVCLTKENRNKPWILFETGALAKGLTTNRVCTFLVDLEPEDLDDPLAQFNHTFPTRDGMFQLVKTINGSLLDARLEDAVIERTFNTYWPQFEKEFARALEINPPSEDVPERTSEDIMGEILNNIRMANNRIRRLENNLSRGDTVGAQLLEEMLNIDGLEGSDVDKIAGYFSASDFEKIKRLRSGINKKG